MLDNRSHLYYEWRVSNLEEARSALFSSALVHWLLLAVLCSGYLYVYPNKPKRAAAR